MSIYVRGNEIYTLRVLHTFWLTIGLLHVIEQGHISTSELKLHKQYEIFYVVRNQSYLFSSQQFCTVKLSGKCYNYALGNTATKSWIPMSIFYISSWNYCVHGHCHLATGTCPFKVCIYQRISLASLYLSPMTMNSNRGMIAIDTQHPPYSMSVFYNDIFDTLCTR